MAAALTATQVKPVAVRQPRFMAREVMQGVLTALIVANCLLAKAADLPQTFSEASPAADSPSNSSPLSPPVLQTNSKVLPADAAFALTGFIEANAGIVLKWDMPPGYYLYQKSLGVELEGGMPIRLDFPEAETITDEFFGEVAVYYASLLLRLPFSALNAKPGTTVELLLTYQGCAEALYCYPPVQKALALKLPE